MKPSKEISAYRDYMLSVRRYLHAHAERSEAEKETTAFIRSELNKLPGVEVYSLGWDLGALALIRGAAPGKTRMFRADIDALPMDEESGLEYASKHPGVCHSCGHDIHASILLGLANYLSAKRESLPGNVWLLFQPAEESLVGAGKMIELGCLEQEPVPEAIYTIHCDPAYPVGTFGLICGRANSSCDKVRIAVKSAGGHGAKSHLCCDSVLTMAELLVSLKNIVAHDNNFMLPTTLTFGHIEGGVAGNVIPKEVVAEGTLRTIYPESRIRLKESIKRACSGIAEAMDAEINLEFVGEGVPSANNDEALFEEVRTLMGDACSIMPLPLSGSEDFALYQEKLPGLYIRLGTHNQSDPATKISLHNAKIRFDEEAMLYALELYKKIVFGGEQ